MLSVSRKQIFKYYFNELCLKGLNERNDLEDARGCYEREDVFTAKQQN